MNLTKPARLSRDLSIGSWLLKKLNKIKKMKNNTWTIRTDSFTTIQEMAHSGTLSSLSLVFSLKQFNFIYKATFNY